VAIPIQRCTFKIALFLILASSLEAISLSAQPPPSASQQNNSSEFDSLAQSAASARDAGHPSDAIPLYRRALALRPGWAEGWWYLGILLYDGDQFRDAIPAFQRVFALAPDAPGTLNFLGLCEFESSEYDPALDHLERGYASGPKDDPQLARVAAYHLVLLLNRAGKFDRAAQVLSKEFSLGTSSDQLSVAFGLTALHVPLLPSEVDPSKDALLNSVGRLTFLSTQGQASQAVDGFPPLLKQYPDLPFLHSAYAAALKSAGRTREAADQLELESKLHPRNSSSAAEVAALYATETYKGRKSPNSPGQKSKSPQENWELARQLFASARYSEAIPVLKEVIAQQQELGTAWAMLGLAEFELKDYDNALLHLQKGATLGLGGSPESVRFARYRLALLLVRNAHFDEGSSLLVPEAEGNSLSTQVQFALGLALLHKALFPEDVPASDSSLVQSAGEISLLLHNSKYDAAFPKLDLLIKSYPNAPMLHYVYGLALASFSRYDEAAVQFTEESRINPQSELPFVQRAFVELQARRPADALLSAQRAVQLAPRSAEAHYVLGRSLLDSAKYEDAAKELEIAAQLNPGSPEVHFNLGKAYAKLNRREDAERERATFARLNAEIEKQRSQHGSQAYGAAHTSSELSQGQTAPPATPPQK
jgi:tetratricopeptide (TPR) repeat protein